MLTAQLRGVIGDEPSDETVAQLLTAAENDVQRAINLHYESPPVPVFAVLPAPRVALAQPSAGKKRPLSEAPSVAQREAGKKQPFSNAPSVTAPFERAVAQNTPPQPASDAPFARRAGAADAQRPSMPLAERMRPRNLDELVGQREALNELVLKAIEADELPSLLLWGPPGCGKTSFAHVLSCRTRCAFRAISAAKANVEAVRSEIARAASALKLCHQRTILFVDEIHRFSKTQQDALLADVEKGIVTLIGATTENPSFSVNNAILSRCRLLVFAKLATDALVATLRRALDTDTAIAGVDAEDETLRALALAADGDARVALNALELAAAGASATDGGEADARKVPDDAGTPLGAASVQPLRARMIRRADVQRAMQARALYDRDGDGHYDLISAMHKSLRGGDVDASLYYIARMLSAGEEPRYVTRRLIRFAAEDVGLADERALPQAIAADQAVAAIGMPEAGVAIAQAATFLACAAKSCAVYRAWNGAMLAAQREPHHAVPLHIRNAPTRLMRDLDYSRGYVYNPANGYSRGCAQGFLPAEMAGRRFFDPRDFEDAEPPCPLPLRHRAAAAMAVEEGVAPKGVAPHGRGDGAFARQADGPVLGELATPQQPPRLDHSDCQAD
ncbi:hypothetical protein KFE25_002090 [Diacronema lutheri]|uniref:AAA+ ATPase domain-containing protein n=1 Tax=Diacronema lutheri TaxID=2081491 RepID=A0A8J5XMS0_DIALT|nr:hypothetical protein KFE25_002090 [Diacronema lutheri]